ncbi:MAG: Crp/Fnr family transcriptional regulator [bacterium]|nr:Crp/Fnr family transcriptional regulator [bacterium]
MPDDQLYRLFPFLTSLKSEIETDRPNRPQIARLPKGQVIFEAGDPCRIIPFLLQGEIRVFTLGENGREMTLYRIRPGESCILSISSLMSQSAIPAIAQVEEEISALVVPAPQFHHWMENYAPIRKFAYALMTQLLASVITTVDEVAFRRMDERIMELIEERADEAGEVFLTHQQIAVELGSSREVVSRILKDFEHKGRVSLGRGQLKLLEP